jgi:hypothetical protein
VFSSLVFCLFFFSCCFDPRARALRTIEIEKLTKMALGIIGYKRGMTRIFTEDGNYRSSPWTDIIGGEDLIKYAFRFASEYAPDTELYYNDYNAWRPTKRDGIIRLVRMLQENDIEATVILLEDVPTVNLTLETPTGQLLTESELTALGVFVVALIVSLATSGGVSDVAFVVYAVALVVLIGLVVVWLIDRGRRGPTPGQP